MMANRYYTKVSYVYEEKLLAFQKYVTGMRKQYSYFLSQIRNVTKTPMHFQIFGHVTEKVKWR
jgi:hypothetical protein